MIILSLPGVSAIKTERTIERSGGGTSYTLLYVIRINTERVDDELGLTNKH